MSFFRRLFGLSTTKKERILAVGNITSGSAVLPDDTYKIALDKMDTTMVEIHTMCDQWIVDVSDMEDEEDELDEK